MKTILGLTREQLMKEIVICECSMAKLAKRLGRPRYEVAQTINGDPRLSRFVQDAYQSRLVELDMEREERGVEEVTRALRNL